MCHQRHWWAFTSYLSNEILGQIATETDKKMFLHSKNGSPWLKPTMRHCLALSRLQPQVSTVEGCRAYLVLSWQSLGILEGPQNLSQKKTQKLLISFSFIILPSLEVFLHYWEALYSGSVCFVTVIGPLTVTHLDNFSEKDQVTYRTQDRWRASFLCLTEFLLSSVRSLSTQ